MAITSKNRRIILAVSAGLASIMTLGMAAASPATVGASKPLQGLCFSPYLTVDPGTELSAGYVNSLLDKVAPYSGGLRTFCSTGIWSKMPAAARARGMSVAGGCDLCADTAYNNVEVNGLVSLCRNRKVDLAVVGDETLSGSGLSEDKLIQYMNKVKATGVPTTTSQTYDELLAHPRVVAACNVVVMNIYPFWEGVKLSSAVAYIDSQYRKTVKAARGKQVIVETGWPSAGQTIGAAVPGAGNAATFLKNFITWADSRGVKYYYFEAFDELWKASREGGVGSHWGIWDQNGTLKPRMSAVLGAR